MPFSVGLLSRAGSFIVAARKSWEEEHEYSMMWDGLFASKCCGDVWEKERKRKRERKRKKERERKKEKERKREWDIQRKKEKEFDTCKAWVVQLVFYNYTICRSKV